MGTSTIETGRGFDEVSTSCYADAHHSLDCFLGQVRCFENHFHWDLRRFRFLRDTSDVCLDGFPFSRSDPSIIRDHIDLVDTEVDVAAGFIGFAPGKLITMWKAKDDAYEGRGVVAERLSKGNVTGSDTDAVSLEFDARLDGFASFILTHFRFEDRCVQIAIQTFHGGEFSCCLRLVQLERLFQ